MIFDKKNNQLWDALFKTDPQFVKPITGKPYKGSSPDPMWVVKRMTEVFGPCGKGWGFNILEDRFEKFGDHETLHIAKLRIWYVMDGDQCFIEQFGQTRAAYVTSKGTFSVDEDAPKKSVTDALVKAASYLGLCADIFTGRWDDSKYVEQVAQEFEDKRAAPAEALYERLQKAESPADVKAIAEEAKANKELMQTSKGKQFVQQCQRKYIDLAAALKASTNKPGEK